MLASAMEKLKDSLSCITHNGAQSTHILIKESSSAATLKKVTLLARQGDWLSFNPDDGRKCKHIHSKCNAVVMSPLLKVGEAGAAHDHHCACDCVVVINRNGELTVVYIDLKSGNPVGYEKQFRSTRQFMRYALGLLEEFHKEKMSIVEERYVILYGGKSSFLNKTSTTPPKMRQSKPDNAYKREVSNPAELYLKELLTDYKGVVA
ncbi:hypothetical protein [Verminephrobacter aporrectodeae]|uniref:hypothetical protein n=2 Tax=Verminephrobacter aporrectodeae TaxID=1110389 RepID=UPI0022446B83|nr:hypothetical protein [Verminephrobacter aporrectodeae]